MIKYLVKQPKHNELSDEKAFKIGRAKQYTCRKALDDNLYRDAGYIYAEDLNEVFAKSIRRLQKYAEYVKDINNAYYSPGGQNIPEVLNAKITINKLMALDHVWSEAQVDSTFITTELKIGRCEPLSSDISPFTADNDRRQFSKRD